MGRFKEIEFKYKADKVSLSAFSAYCRILTGPMRYILASGFDHFYEKANESGCFCRHRIGPDMNQLTFKRKTTENNNFIRTEHNLDLLSSIGQAQIEAFCQEFGYRFNCSIFKDCFIFKFPRYTLVYYVCYDPDMHELGRFIEIEMDESYPWEDDKEAMLELTGIEANLRQFGITPQARVKRSLYEMFRKEME